MTEPDDDAVPTGPDPSTEPGIRTPPNPGRLPPPRLPEKHDPDDTENPEPGPTSPADPDDAPEPPPIAPDHLPGGG